jgi:hydrogenase-4 component B
VKILKYLPAGTISFCSLLALVYILLTFHSYESGPAVQVMGWQLPFAAMIIGIDSLSGFFLIPLLILAFTCSIYGPQYFHDHPVEKSHWPFFGLLVAGMMMVLLARNAILFIIAWEVMSLSSFFLVITDKESSSAMRAGWIYFITAHVGTAFLLCLFLFLGALSGSFNFDAWKEMALSGTAADALFILALVAFGMKAGFIPFHIWLPLAHPSAPSHVSALMSGVMIKMGIYGILRILTILAPYHPWWGGLLIAIGGVSGILGVLFAIGQHDIKRLLAYHSVENIGIILLGIGIGILGAAYGSGLIAFLGFTGGLLHVVNHSLFKGLLFLGAGSVLRQTGSGQIDELGGLIKRMPGTALFFLVGSVAICGLPFFNGFISELMIYVAGITGAVKSTSPGFAMAGLAAVLCLALIGGLAAACFAKAFGIVFLGEARTEKALVKHDVPFSMRAAMAILAALCLVVGMASPLVMTYLLPPVLLLAGQGASPYTSVATSLAWTVTIVLWAVVAAVFLSVVLARVFRSRKQPVARTVTWDCGYISPDVSMQYTASSFAAPIVEQFKVPLAAHRRVSLDAGLFPRRVWTFHSGVEDWFLTRFYTPAIEILDRLFEHVRWFQSGKTGQYILYIAITIFCLIIWKFFL